ncbi:hypothetical protein [Euryhalocaulis caribicus]|uniref:hypothetical protein n=1 Tax=Euryhalocaulis caribicus TaxID=1161401 RepID=UPI000399A34E|nr:hypothetical protein [Euryhalocaulis caribicus]
MTDTLTSPETPRGPSPIPARTGGAAAPSSCAQAEGGPLPGAAATVTHPVILALPCIQQPGRERRYACRSPEDAAALIRQLRPHDRLAVKPLLDDACSVWRCHPDGDLSEGAGMVTGADAERMIAAFARIGGEAH